MSSAVRPRSGLLADEPPERVEVTSHARLKWLERVDPTEPHPGGAVRAAWERSTRTDEHPAARAVDGLYLIYDVLRDRTVILTVFPRRRGAR